MGQNQCCSKPRPGEGGGARLAACREGCPPPSSGGEEQAGAGAAGQEEVWEEEAEPEPWRFSHRCALEDLADPERRRAFLAQYVRWEAEFINGPGLNRSGLTNDGANADGSERPWSAASKEALHLCVLARRLSMPSPLCQHLMSQERAVELLEKKADRYEAFRREHPEFHGFLPWFHSDTLTPTSGWERRWPCLDNGQFAWALYEAVHATEGAGHRGLSARLRAHFEEMCEFAVLGGYGGDGRIAMTCHISEDGGYRPEGHDPMPWDQEPFSYFLDLFGSWRKAGYGDDERDKVWADVRRCEGVQCVPFRANERQIAVLKGWHFSAHEMWKYLQLPLRNIECARNVLENGERARTHFAAENGLAGLFASCTAPDNSYMDIVGIGEGISLLDESHTPVLTPYGGFPTILADEAAGAAWLKTILDGKDMQTPLGCCESIWADGSGVCRILTWDAKVTTVLAVLGGGDHLERCLKADGLWNRFEQITKQLYHGKFGCDLLGRELPIRLPTTKLPS